MFVLGHAKIKCDTWALEVIPDDHHILENMVTEELLQG